MSTAVDGRRAVRDRNAHAILAAAIDVLTEDPNAGMAVIAARAGVGRATLYRHYPTREDLRAAILAQVAETFDALLDQLRADTGDAAAALERFISGLTVLREGYAAIAASAPPDREEKARAVWIGLTDWVISRQADGQIDPTLDPLWVLASLRGLLRAAALEVDAGALATTAAPALVVRTFLCGVSAPAAASPDPTPR